VELAILKNEVQNMGIELLDLTEPETTEQAYRRGYMDGFSTVIAFLELLVGNVSEKQKARLEHISDFASDILKQWESEKIVDR
jgi:uncharacterized protein YnzC (UPF0291/DUF896 family)